MAQKTHTDVWWERNTNPAVVRCSAHYKTTGERCRTEVYAPGMTVCWKHGGKARQVVTAAARRMQENAETAERVLREMLTDATVPPGDRIKAAVAYLDRAGVVPENRLNVEVEVRVDPVEELLRTVLSDPNGLVAPVVAQARPALPAAAEDDSEDIVDAELVPEPEPAPPEPSYSGTPRHIREALDLLL